MPPPLSTITAWPKWGVRPLHSVRLLCQPSKFWVQQLWKDLAPPIKKRRRNRRHHRCILCALPLTPRFGTWFLFSKGPFGHEWNASSLSQVALCLLRSSLLLWSLAYFLVQLEWFMCLILTRRWSASEPWWLNGGIIYVFQMLVTFPGFFCYN